MWIYQGCHHGSLTERVSTVTNKTSNHNIRGTMVIVQQSNFCDKKIGTLTITTYNDEENNEATSVESAPNTSSDDPEHAGTQQLSSLTQIRNSTKVEVEPCRQESFKSLIQNLHKFEQGTKRSWSPSNSTKAHWTHSKKHTPSSPTWKRSRATSAYGRAKRRIIVKEPSKIFEFVCIDVVPLKFVLIDHHKLRQEIWTRPARDMLRPFQTFKQFIAQPKVRNIDLKAAKEGVPGQNRKLSSVPLI
ncbi:hypothetical protein BLNAU_25083 [Blattamonas nauphoetae]|uniref:Uncharacterized protein n=1 Tax=Blattamonas nauphoetae TaxID=2049346 RepID=A0ABQ9WKL6_9EUKA|nr:hypothetical protein BLNAU_25083 [Blattamonas nauphoetae]